MDEMGQAIRKGREILLTDEKTCRKVDGAEKAVRRAGKQCELLGLGIRPGINEVVHDSSDVNRKGKMSIY